MEAAGNSSDNVRSSNRHSLILSSGRFEENRLELDLSGLWQIEKIYGGLGSWFHQSVEEK